MQFRAKVGYLLAFSVFVPLAVWAEETAPDVGSDEVLAAEEPLFTPEDLDKLVGPVALYPDSLLTQVLVAATYPLDVMKADRFVTASADLEDKVRSEQAQLQPWDPSVQVLAGGFPTLITRMAEHIDYTELLGSAVVLQSDDVLAAVQRMRDLAAEAGNLESNDIQTVTVEGDNITIAPADPQVVYVPTYDSSQVYSTAPTGSVVIVDDDDDYDVNNGAIMFFSLFALNEIFDDDDYWGGYWHGPGRIDWDDNDFHPRPDIDIGGDLTINNGNQINIDRDKINIDRDKIKIDRDKLAVGNNRPGIDRLPGNRPNNDLVETLPGRRPGDLSPDQLNALKGKDFQPNQDRVREARERAESMRDVDKGALADKAGSLNRPSTLPQITDRPKTKDRPKVNTPPKVSGNSGNRPDLTRPANDRPKVKPKTKPKPSADKFDRSGGRRAAAASDRGRGSNFNRRK